MLQNLDDRTPVANPDGSPTHYFMRLVQKRGTLLEEALDVTRAVPPFPFYPYDADALGIDPYATFYVNATAGSDTNDGLTAATAWQTFDFAVGYIARLRWTKKAGRCSLRLADGNYQTSFSFDYEGFPPLLGSTGINIYGNNSDASAVVLDTQGYLINQIGADIYLNTITLDNFKAIWSVNSNCFFAGCRFTNIIGSSTRSLFQAYDGGEIFLADDTELAFTAAQTSEAIFQGLSGGQIHTNGTITITGSPTMATATAYIKELSIGDFKYRDVATSFVGTVTGKRYQAEVQSTIYTGNGGASYLPGTVAGTVDAGSWYDALPEGEGVWGPVVDGSFPPVFVQNPDGSLVLAEYV